MENKSQYFNKAAIDEMALRQRTLLINSLTGFKSANLIGTSDKAGQTNLAIVSSAFHIGANPALMGFLFRPHSVPRDTLENILSTQYFSMNHVHSDIVKQAHQTSARYPKSVSEFKAVGLNEQWIDGFPAPYVKESHIKVGLKFCEQHHLSINATELVIAEIENIIIPDGILEEDGYLDIEKANTVAVSSLESYHTTRQIDRLSYAKVK